jgi:hypothetical protein
MKAFLLALLLVAGSASAQAADRYPSRVIKLVVAFAPGGVADIMGRMIGQALQQQHNNRTASYLLGEPLLSDYLEEGLSQFGLSCAEFEIERL